MSHFVVWVMAPADAVAAVGAEDVAEARLAPFSENLEVPAYTRECRCAEWAAHREAKRISQEQNADLVREIRDERSRLSAERTRLEESMPSNAAREALAARQQEEWATHIVPVISRIDAVEEVLFASLKATQRPDVACPDCRGTGAYLSTYNPDAKWDWWEIGGRWRGAFDPTGAGRDVLPVSEVMDEDGQVPLFPVAIIDPEGAWHEEGSVGWFGVMSDQKAAAQWEDEAQALFARYPNHTIIVCDCHI